MKTAETFEEFEKADRMARTRALDLDCPFCPSQQGEQCVTRSDRPAKMHWSRYKTLAIAARRDEGWRFG